MVLLARIVTLPFLMAAQITQRKIFLHWALVAMTHISRAEGITLSLFILRWAGEHEELAKELIPQSIREEVWVRHRRLTQHD